MGEFTGTGPQEDFDLVVAQCNNEIQRLVAVQIVDRNCDGSSMNGIARPLLKLSICSAEQNGNFVGT